MKHNLLNPVLSIILSMLVLLPLTAGAEALSQRTDIFEGYYSREGNNGTPTRVNHHDIYMKLYKKKGQQWVALLHIPLPYAATVDPAVIPKIFEEIDKKIHSSAYVRDTFGYLDEPATVQFEHFGYLGDKLIFECGSLSPCTIKPADGYLELIKPGMLNEHIIRYNHIRP